MSIDSFKGLDPVMLAKMISQAEEQKKERDVATKTSGGGDFIPTAYLPEGKHTLRILADPELTMYRMVRYFTLQDPFKRIPDPRHYKTPEGKYVIGETEVSQEYIDSIWERTGKLDWRQGSRTNCLFYGLLIKTDSPSEYWKEGNLYLIQANQKFESSWLTQMSNFVANEEINKHIANSMNPTVEGWAWDVVVVGGTQGSISLTPTFMKNHPAAVIDDKYIPLKQQVVRDEFTAEDMARLDKYLDGAVAEVNKDEVDDAPAPPEEAPKDDTPEETKTEEVKEDESSAEEESSDDVTYGLSEAEMTAAKAAGLDFQTFSKMIGRT